MAGTFYEKPILNSPYEEPTLYHALDEKGQPTDQPPVLGRRKSELITAIPKARKKKSKASGEQANLDLHGDDGISSDVQEQST